MKEMKVLNISQPFAHYVVAGGKNIENRSKPVNFRGTILIYASKTKKLENFEDEDIQPDDCAFGAIIGIADVIDCITEEEVTDATDEWFMGPYGYVLANMVEFKKPIEVKPPQGAITWWNLSGSQLKACLDQVKERDLLPIKSVKKDFKGASINKKFNPTKKLGAVIGTSPVTFDGALKRLIKYCSQHDIEATDESLFCDTPLKELFGKKEIQFKEVADIIKENLKASA